jgi:carboxylate-amine ligase
MKPLRETGEPSEQAAAGEPLEDLDFHGSAQASLGVEIELQILDRESGDLAPGAVQVLQACAEDPVEGVTAELMQSMIEVKTGVCRDVAAVRDSLVPQLRRVRNIATSLGYDLALGGTHPFSRAGAAAVFPAERYQRLQEHYAWLTNQMLVFGLHVHVGVPDGDRALRVTNAAVAYLPHLLALSANSPFWQGVDTGLASTRAAIFRLLPHAGVPPYFADWPDFCEYCRVMHACGAIQSTKDIYWDIRPRPQQGTVEFRICDVPASLEVLLGLVALIRTVVVAAGQKLTEGPDGEGGDPRRHWIAVENKWRATRYGLKAQCIRTPGQAFRTLGEDVDRLLEQLAPIAQEGGDESFLGVLRPAGSFETGSERQRRLYRSTGDWKAVTAEMVGRWAEELGTADAVAPNPQASGRTAR